MLAVLLDSQTRETRVKLLEQRTFSNHTVLDIAQQLGHSSTVALIQSSTCCACLGCILTQWPLSFDCHPHSGSWSTLTTPCACVFPLDLSMRADGRHVDSAVCSPLKAGNLSPILTPDSADANLEPYFIVNSLASFQPVLIQPNN